jgi:hypothetical protein
MRYARPAAGSLVLLLCLVATAGAEGPPAKEPVVLKWKIPKAGAMAYKTSMEALDPDANTVDFTPMFKALANMMGVDESEMAPSGDGETRDAWQKEMNEFFESMQLPDAYSMTTVLTPRDNGNLSVKMIMDPLPEAGAAEKPAEGIGEMFRSLMKGVQLRGEVTPRGKIASFYLESKQKNLLAIFFGLPGRPVREGDEWALDASLISMGHGFICKKARRVNRVRLASVEPTDDGDRVANLDYTLYESVEGDFMSPFGGGNKTPTSMAIGFAGRGEFLIGKGAWRRFVGHMWLKSTGMMSANTRQRFALEPTDDVPKAYLKLE